MSCNCLLFVQVLPVLNNSPDPEAAKLLSSRTTLHYLSITIHFFQHFLIETAVFTEKIYFSMKQKAIKR